MPSDGSPRRPRDRGRRTRGRGADGPGAARLLRRSLAAWTGAGAIRRRPQAAAAAVWSRAGRAARRPAAGRVDGDRKPGRATRCRTWVPRRRGPVVVMPQPAGAGSAPRHRSSARRSGTSGGGVRRTARGAAGASRVILRPHPLDCDRLWRRCSSGSATESRDRPRAADHGAARGRVAVHRPRVHRAAAGRRRRRAPIFLDMTGCSCAVAIRRGPGRSRRPRRRGAGRQRGPSRARRDGAEAAREALGARPDAVERVLDLVLASA